MASRSVTCPFCNKTVVGTVDPTNSKNTAVPHHRAPCGFVCSASPSTSVRDGETLHGPVHCTKCGRMA